MNLANISKMHMDDMKSDPTPQKSEKGVPPEVSKKWGLLVFKIYERMVHASDVSFFISSPQIISTLGFILGVADTEDTKGLMKAYANGATDEQGANIDWLLDNTLKFVHNWSAEFKQLLGQYHRARRVYAHPKFVMPHNANTFQFFRLFRVQEKIFEGYEEVRDWAARSLKADFPESQRILNIWESDMDPADRMEQQKMGNAMKEEFKKGKNAEFSSWRPKKDPKETEKKSPILIWTSHAVVEMLSDIFDSKVIYTWNRREYLRFHESAQRKIRVTAGSFDFETIILPTQSRQLVFLIFYGIQSHLCSMTQLNEFVLNHHLQSPCIVRRRKSKNLAPKSTIYLPNWKAQDFPASRIGHHLAATIDLNSVFVAGGLGDLAWSDAIPSSTGDPKKIGHIQHFGLLSFGNAPGTTKKKIDKKAMDKAKKNKENSDSQKNRRKLTKKSINERNATDVEIIPHPLCVILWDCYRELPAYMGKINGEMTMEERSEMERNKMTNRKSRIFSCIG